MNFPLAVMFEMFSNTKCWPSLSVKVAFFQKVRFVFQISKSQKKKESKKLSWIYNFHHNTVLGGNFKFQVGDSFLKYFFLDIWRFENRIALSEKKPPLADIVCVKVTSNSNMYATLFSWTQVEQKLNTSWTLLRHFFHQN